MGKIKTESIEIGMVLSEDITLGTQTLLVKGSMIKSHHMKIFKSWGVTAIDVDSMGIDKKLFFIMSDFSASSFRKSVESIALAEAEEIEEKKEREKKLKERFFRVDRSFGPANILYEYCFLH